jgi:hypothetical protein
MGAVPHRCAQVASDRSRPGLSPAVTSKAAAADPHAVQCQQVWGVWVTSLDSRASRCDFLLIQGRHPAPEDPQGGLGGDDDRVRAFALPGAQRRRPGGQLLAGGTGQGLPQILRGGGAQMADLVEGLDVDRPGRALGRHQSALLASTFASRVLAAPQARPDIAARAASMASSGSDLPARRRAWRSRHCVSRSVLPGR